MNLKQELARKAIHQTALLIPLVYLFVSRSTVLMLLVPITCIVIATDIARRVVPWVQRIFNKLFGSVLRVHEERGFTGSSYLLTGAVATIWIFPKHYAILSLLFLIISDAAAALTGKSVGKHKIFNKTAEGSAAFLVTSCIIAGLYSPIPAIQAFTGALAATIFELIPLSIDDNFLIPLGTSSVIWLLYL